jgi:hypothetical protein
MKRGTKRNYPRRKTWVVLARDETAGLLAVLTPGGKFNIVGENTIAKGYYLSDRDIEYYLPLQFSKEAYRELESSKVQKALYLTKPGSVRLGANWKVFIARLGSSKCPVDHEVLHGKILLSERDPSCDTL